MPDREKVIDGIEETISYLRCHEGTLIERLIQHQNDALALLKEQDESPKIVMSVKASGSGTVIGRCDSLVINR